MVRFDPNAYGVAIGELLRTSRLPELGKGSPALKYEPLLDAFAASPMLGRPATNYAAAHLLVGAIYLHFDLWEKSHDVIQKIDSPHGWYWHAILHRREPDAQNAKYWYQQVTRHPVVIEMSAEPGYGSPEQFIDLCERVRGTNTPEEEQAKQLQLLEWQRLFHHCFMRAVS